jgi:class 3 adenylate cyclase
MSSQEQAIVGETPNLAARLQSVAEPNSVVIAEDTRKPSMIASTRRAPYTGALSCLARKLLIALWRLVREGVGHSRSRDP